jgi:ABC-type lipoprotein export system ATPase subunit
VSKLTGLTRLYHKGRRTVPAVRDLDLVIADGEWLAVQGRAGHGKCTLLNLLGGLDRPTLGTVEQSDCSAAGRARRPPGRLSQPAGNATCRRPGGRCDETIGGRGCS